MRWRAFAAEMGGSSGRDFAIMLAALAAGLFAAPPIRDSLGWPDDTLYTVGITIPVMVIVHQALLRIFRRRP